MRAVVNEDVVATEAEAEAAVNEDVAVTTEAEAAAITGQEANFTVAIVHGSSIAKHNCKLM